MSTVFPQLQQDEPAKPQVRVSAFVDGFNLYHALEKLTPAAPVADPDRYQKYKWLCLKTLISQFLLTQTEALAEVHYFSALPNWHNSAAKAQRHQVYMSAQRHMGVKITLGEFKAKDVTCLATCGRPFQTYVEKQTDINIAIKMIETAATYDKAILVTGDSDQVPTIRLLRQLYPTKTFAALIPIGRSARELQRACHESYRMTENHLMKSQLPNPIEIKREGRSSVLIVKPPRWP